MNFIDIDNKKIFYLIIFFHIFTRILVFSYNLNENTLAYDQDYITALNNKNFLDYLFFHHSLTVGPHIISKLALIISGEENLYLFHYTLNIIYSAIFIYVAFNIFVYFIKNNKLNTLLLLILSISLISYETWRVHHYDHIVLALTSLLALFFFNLFVLKKNNIIFFSVLMFFFILFSSLFIIIFIISIICLIFFSKNLRLSLNKYFYISTFLILIFSIQLLKNKINLDQYFPTSIKGWSHIQRTLYSIGIENYFKLTLTEINLPLINKICIKNIKDNKELISKNNNDLFLSIVLNKCFFDYKNKIYDYEILRKNLKKNKINDKNLELAISQDEKDLKNRKWIFSGGHLDINLRTTVYFHKEAFKIYLNAIKFYPYEMIIGSPYSTEGEGIFFSFLKMLRWGGQLPNYYEPQHTGFSNNFLIFFKYIISIFFMIGIVMNLYISLKTLNLFIKKKQLSELNMFITTISMNIFGFLFTTSSLTCCENQRNAVMVYPLISITCILSLVFIFNFRKKI